MISSAPFTPAEMTPIKTVGRFVLYRELGTGAVGTVYYGHDPVIDRAVAIKVFNQHGPLFINEARAAGRLSHPNIVTIFDAASEGDVSFIAMEYLQGQDLRQLLVEERPLSFLTVAQIVQKIAEGLHYAHKEGVIHRDIKPANIFIQENMQCKLVDFGVACAQDDEKSQVSGEQALFGTPNYMSPEQAQSKTVDKLTDIYSLGAVMYEMLVREQPFQSSDTRELIHQIVHKKIKAPHEINPDIPLALSRIVVKAMEKNPVKRYQSAAAMALDLRRYVLIEKRRQKPEQRSSNSNNTSIKRQFWLGWIAVLIAAAVVLYLWVHHRAIFLS